MLGFDSKIKEIYATPIGHDILYKLLLQLNKSEKLIINPLVGNLRIKTLAALTKKTLGKDFYRTFLELVNTDIEGDTGKRKGEVKPKWWKEATFYQIYPRSFKDSNGDGIGDLGGINEKLDYLKELGVDAIWLSPIYDSPNDDNGYDIRDYYQIMNEFGTMEEFDQLLNEVHQRGMKLIMDLVVNHTSDEHPWFQAAIKEKNSKYKDYYLFQKGTKNQPPNNWTSFFRGTAWNYYENIDEWGLHLFSKKQMDLNWENQEVRKDIQAMVRWWLQKGIDGFRLDVINYISKRDGLPDGNETIGKLMGYYGIEHYFHGPKLHKYLKELRREAFEPFDAFSVGETPGVGILMSKLLSADYRRELDMVFSFDHLETPGHVRFEEYNYDLNYLKKYMTQWMECYGNHCWMSLFYENHDNPRMISKVNKDTRYREVIAKLLAMIQFTLKGTPFVFQGQELGLMNKDFHSIDDMKDVESINYYHELKKDIGEDKAFAVVMSGSRDHARTPMPWDSSSNAGFSTVTPWISNDDDYLNYNVKQQLEENNSILNFYKRLIQLRKENKALVYGDFKILNRNSKNLFTYKRTLNKETYLVECNLSSHSIKRKVVTTGYELILSNYNQSSQDLRPYESNLYVQKS